MTFYVYRIFQVASAVAYLHFRTNLRRSYPSVLFFVPHDYFHTTAFMSKQRKSKGEKKSKNIIQYKPKSKQPVVQLWRGITVAELSRMTNRNLSMVFEAITYLENRSLYSHPNSEIHDSLTLKELAMKLGYRVQFIKPPAKEEVLKKEIKDLIRRPPPDPKILVKRPPVVAIMGHVDHGKTTLLDALRNSSIASQEHGFITQHIGAFSVKLPEGEITFLDTPGHAAFHTMRSRGARATDIVILVVAADDGVMEQTIESIKFAKEANVPIIVAINKIDKSSVDKTEIARQLLAHGLQLEDIGGDVISVCISALKKINLDHLTEAILTLAEVMEVGCDPTGPVEGIVLESCVDANKRGKFSTALIQRGCLKKGALLIAGTCYAKVRSMYDDKGVQLSEVRPGNPAQIFGWKNLPLAGEIILEAESEKRALQVIHYRENLMMEEKTKSDYVVIQKKEQEHLQKYREERTERLLKGRRRKERSYFRAKELYVDALPCLSVVLKGDVHGSVEAILDVINTYKAHEECRLDVIHSGVGNVTENDVILAETFDGIIYCFNVNIPPPIKNIAQDSNVPVKAFNIIYHLIDDVKMEISTRLPLTRKENIVGEATVQEQFLINEGKKKVPVAGCRCTKGIITKGKCKVMRSDEVIYEGTLISLKHEKEDVETIKKNSECGLRVEDNTVFYEPGDQIICFTEEYVPQSTDWNPGF